MYNNKNNIIIIIKIVKIIIKYKYFNKKKYLFKNL